jgi:hypothetical protein
VRPVSGSRHWPAIAAGGGEHEGARAEGRVGNDEAGCRPRAAIPQHDIEIEHPRAPALAAPAAAEAALDPQQVIEHLVGIEPGLHDGRAIGKAAQRRAKGPARHDPRSRDQLARLVIQSRQRRPQNGFGRYRSGGAAGSSRARRDSGALPPSPSDVLGDPAVELRPAIAEKAHAGTVRAGLIQDRIVAISIAGFGIAVDRRRQSPHSSVMKLVPVEVCWSHGHRSSSLPMRLAAITGMQFD